MTTLPVKKVVVMEDRAQVERRGTVPLSGVTKVEIDGLSMVAVDRSLKLEVKGGTLINAKFERRWREQPKDQLPADASALCNRAEYMLDSPMTCPRRRAPCISRPRTCGRAAV